MNSVYLKNKWLPAWFCILFSFFLFFLVGQSAYAACSWTGEWRYTYTSPYSTHDFSSLFTQTGNSVYTGNEYLGTGTVSGNTLILPTCNTLNGECVRPGRIIFVMDANCNSFSGYCEFDDHGPCESTFAGVRLSVNQPPEVSLTYSQPEGSMAGQPVILTVEATDPDGDKLTYQWYLNGVFQVENEITTATISSPVAGTHTCRVVVQDGRGGEDEDSVEFTVIDPAANDLFTLTQGEGGEQIAVILEVTSNGEKVSDSEKTKLYLGAKIETGPGVEVLVRYTSGAVQRIYPNTEFTIEKLKHVGPAREEVYGRLWKGICNFYWPPGGKTYKKFQLETRRAIVGIKGTTFTVSDNSKTTSVNVEEGIVEVTSLADGTVRQIQSGETFVLNNSETLMEGLYNYYLPYYSSANGDWTGLGLANLNQSSSSLYRVEVYNESGELLLSANDVIEARAQDSFPLATQFNSKGWIRVNSFEPLSGLAFLGKGSAPYLMADIPFTDSLSTSLTIPHTAQDATWDTDILICNPNFSQVSFSLKFVDQQGRQQGIKNFTIPAMGSESYSLSSVFSGTIPLAGKIEITSSVDIAAFALYDSSKSGGTYCAGINAVSQNKSEEINNYYLPYYSSENGDWTGLGLSNDNGYSSSPQVIVYDKDGNILESTYCFMSANGQVSFPVAPEVHDLGWIQVVSLEALDGLAFIGTGGAAHLMADIPFTESLYSRLIVPHVAQDATWDTALMICNPNPEKASITIKNIDKIGDINGTTEKVLTAYGSGKYRLSDLFPGASPVDGSLEIISSTGLCGFALYTNQKTGGYYFAGISAVAYE